MGPFVVSRFSVMLHLEVNRKQNLPRLEASMSFKRKTQIVTKETDDDGEGNECLLSLTAARVQRQK